MGGVVKGRVITGVSATDNVLFFSAFTVCKAPYAAKNPTFSASDSYFAVLLIFFGSLFFKKMLLQLCLLIPNSRYTGHNA